MEADPTYAVIQNRTVARLPESSAPLTVLCAAIADRAGILDFAIPKNRGHTRNRLTAVAGNGDGETWWTRQFVALTADFLLTRRPRLDSGKMDVEDTELLALACAPASLGNVRWTLYIQVAEENVGAISEIFQNYD
jgi:hypothetical protein